MHSGELHWECFCESSPLELSTRLIDDQTTSYPLASSIVFLPLFITRCVLFSGYSVPLTVMIFRDTMSRLSGAIDVLLFLNVRRRLLLFPRPGRLAEPDIELAPQGTRSAALPADEGSGNSSAQIRVSSKRISDDI